MDAQRTRPGFLVPLALVATTLLSAFVAYGGVIFLAMSAMCYDYGPSARADACQAEALLVGGTGVATLAIPVLVGVWARRARTTSGTLRRIAACLTGYLVPLLALLAASG